MGAGTGNLNKIGAAQRQQAMEGQSMRRRALQQQEQYAPTQEQVTPLETSAPQTGFGLEATPQPSMGRDPEMRSGLSFGPGRATRIPEQGSPDYEQLLQRVRGLGKGRR